LTLKMFTAIMDRLSDDNSEVRQVAIDIIGKLTEYGQLSIQRWSKLFNTTTGLLSEIIVNLISELGLRSDIVRKDALKFIMSLLNQGQITFQL
jgi:HEAT repeat protein